MPDMQKMSRMPENGQEQQKQPPILYGEVQRLEASEFQLRLETAGGQVVFSRMGQELEWLADKLRNAYNDTVVSALLITGKPILAARESRFTWYHAK